MSLLNHRTVILHPRFSQLGNFFESLPERFDRGEGEVIYKGRNELRKITYEGCSYIVKSFRCPNFINRFVYGIFRPSKAKRAFDHACLFLKIGVGTPFPVGYLNVRNGVLFDQSYLVTLESKCTHVYRELFEKKFDYEDEVLREIARVTAVLHAHGYAHKDYGRGNILFEKTADGMQIELVDLNRLAVGPLDLKAGCKNMERLPCTPHMHRVFADEYAKLRGFDADECYRLLQAYRSVQPGKIDGLY